MSAKSLRHFAADMLRALRAAVDVPHPTPPCEPDPIAAMWDRWAAGVRADVETLRAELDDPAAVARWLESAL